MITFLKDYPKLFKKCKKEEISYYLLSGFNKPSNNIKNFIDILSGDLCSNGKTKNNIKFYIEELNKLNGY